MCIRNALSVDQRVDGADAAGYIFKSVYQRHCSLLVWGCDVSSRKTKRLQPHNCISQILPSNIESKVCHVQTELRESSVVLQIAGKSQLRRCRDLSCETPTARQRRSCDLPAI